jgi:hypothetical protein
MTKILGMPEQLRDYSFPQILAADSVRDITLEVIPPKGAKTFQIGVQHRCRTCILEKGVVRGIVNVNLPYINPRPFIFPKLLLPQLPRLTTLNSAPPKP